MNYNYAFLDSSTSAGHRFGANPLPHFIGFFFADLSSTKSTAANETVCSPADYYTYGNLNIFPVFQNTAKSIHELRLKTGLTWDQIAELFNVSRRSVHFWANGKPMEDFRAEKLHYLTMAVRKFDPIFATQNRRLLFDKDVSGISLFDLLKRGDFYLANLRMSSFTMRPAHQFKPLSATGHAEIGIDSMISPFDLLETDNRYLPDRPTKVSVVHVKKIKKEW